MRFGTNRAIREGADLRHDAINIVIAPFRRDKEFQVARLGDLAWMPSAQKDWRWLPDPANEADWSDSNGTPFGEMRVLEFVDPTMLAGLYRNLATLTGTGILKYVLDGVHESVQSLQSKAPSLYLKILLPLATQLLSSVRGNAGPDDAAIARRIYKASRLLWQWILLEFVGPLPPHTSMSMSHVKCRCGDCSQLNRFLSDGRQTQVKLPAGRTKRQHISEQIDRVHRGEVFHRDHLAGKPQSLFVIKKPGARAKRERVIWARKAANIREALLSIPEEILREALKPDFFEILPGATMEAMLGESLGDFKRMFRAETPTTATVATPEREVESNDEMVFHQTAVNRRKRALESPQEHVGMRTRTRRRLARD